MADKACSCSALEELPFRGLQVLPRAVLSPGSGHNQSSSLLLSEIPRHRRAWIGLEAAKLPPVIDDDKVEVYRGALDQINGDGAGALGGHGIGGPLVNKRENCPIQALGPFTVAESLAITDDTSDGGVRPGQVPGRDGPRKGGTERTVDAFERTLRGFCVSDGKHEKYEPEPHHDRKTYGQPCAVHGLSPLDRVM
jgi:hypothetical protein